MIRKFGVIGYFDILCGDTGQRIFFADNQDSSITYGGSACHYTITNAFLVGIFLRSDKDSTMLQRQHAQNAIMNPSAFFVRLVSYLKALGSM